MSKDIASALAERTLEPRRGLERQAKKGDKAPDVASILVGDASPTPDGILELQRLAGNKAVSSLLHPDGASVRPLVEKAVSSPGEPRFVSRSPGTTAGGAFDVAPPATAMRVHSDREATEALGARGFSVGDDVVLHPDYAPGTQRGDEVLAHETTHFLQNRAGPVPGDPIGNDVRVSDPGDAHEQKATGAEHAGRLDFHEGPTGASAGSVSHGGLGGQMVIQRALLDDGKSLQVLLEGLQGVANASTGEGKAPKKGFFAKLKQVASSIFTSRRAKAKTDKPSEGKEKARAAQSAVEEVSMVADRAMQMRVGFREPMGPVAERQSAANDWIAELEVMKTKLGNSKMYLKEVGATLHEYDEAINGLEHDIAVMRRLGADRRYPDEQTWAQASVVASGHVAIDHVKDLHDTFAEEAAKDNQGKGGDAQNAAAAQTENKTVAQVGRTGIDMFKDYMRSYAAGAVVGAGIQAIDGFWKEHRQQGDQKDSQLEKSDPKVTDLAVKLAGSLGTVVCPPDGGWAVADGAVLDKAAAILKYAEEQFGQGTKIAEAFVLRNMVWLGAQAPLLLSASNLAGLERTASVESLRAFMEAIFGSRNQSSAELYTAWEQIVDPFGQALLSKVREHMPTEQQLVNVN